MNKDNKIPNRKIRTILLVCVLVVYVATTIYVLITKDNNKLVGSYHDYNIYEDKDDYYDDYYDDDYDDYDDYYDDDYNDYYENKDGALSTTSAEVTSLYSYIKLYPQITGLKSSFKVSELTAEEKLRLVAASLKSKNITTSQPVGDVTETELVLNEKTYTAVNPNVRYARYEVTSMYYDIFGTTTDFDYNALMYDGDDIVYKYIESANGYVKYVANSPQSVQAPKSEIESATRKGKNIEIYVKVGNQTEKYIFTQKEGYTYIYTFTERVVEEKNSL